MRRSDQPGFTLIELMIAMAIGSILMVAVVSAYQIQVSSKNTQEALTDMNTTARAALEIMTQELSTAGCDPNNTDTAGIVNATANDLTFTMDIGNTAGNTFRPDGLLDGPNEQIRYAINAAKAAIRHIILSCSFQRFRAPHYPAPRGLDTPHAARIGWRAKSRKEPP